MHRSSLFGLAIAALLSACGPKAAPTTTGTGTGSGSGTDAVPEGPRDQAVEEGDGWSSDDPGIWHNNLDTQDLPDASLSAEPGARGMERFTLPKGANGGSVETFFVHYETPGRARWTVHADAGGQPGPALGEVEVVIAADDVGMYSEHAFNPTVPVEGPFFLVFEVIDGSPEVSALQGCCAEVFYQPPGADQAQAVPNFIPRIHPYLVDVH